MTDKEKLTNSFGSSNRRRKKPSLDEIEKIAREVPANTTGPAKPKPKVATKKPTKAKPKKVVKQTTTPPTTKCLPLAFWTGLPEVFDFSLERIDRSTPSPNGG